MSEFNDVVARVPSWWGRKVVTVMGVTNGIATVARTDSAQVLRVPVSELERVGKNPVPTIATRQPRKRSEVC